MGGLCSWADDEAKTEAVPGTKIVEAPPVGERAVNGFTHPSQQILQQEPQIVAPQVNLVLPVETKPSIEEEFVKTITSIEIKDPGVSVRSSPSLPEQKKREELGPFIYEIRGSTDNLELVHDFKEVQDETYYGFM